MNTQLTEAFQKFHEANPEVYRLFKKYTFAAIGTGRKHYSANAIFERIRWHLDIDTESDCGFKLNNNHRAYYARLFHEDHPEHKGFFRNRELKQPKPLWKVLFDSEYYKEINKINRPIDVV